jgi:hypothetical protein
MERDEMLKKVVKLVTVLSLLIVSPGYGQSSGLNGRVIDKDNKPVQGATVKLITAKKSQNTDQDGKFYIEMPLKLVGSSIANSEMITFHNGMISFQVTGNQQQIDVDVFDSKGKRVNNISQKITGKGTIQSSILPDDLPVAMYFVKLRIGNRNSFFRVMNFKNRNCTLLGSAPYSQKTFVTSFAALEAIVDSLEVSKSGYLTSKQGISSYAAQLPDIVLQLQNNEEGLPPVVNGKSAKTTRYWDCCKPHCGWYSNMRMCDISGNTISDKNAKSSCDGGPAFQCMDYAPIEVNSKVSYGWAAFNNSGTQCGDCYQLDFQGSLSGKQMIVQTINIGDGGTDAFDLLIPGGGVGAFNGCSRQWNNAPLGAQYGGFPTTCGRDAACIRSMAQKAFGDKPNLMRGVEWYINWFDMTNNPNVLYSKVPCPQKIKDISLIGN